MLHTLCVFHCVQLPKCVCVSGSQKAAVIPNSDNIVCGVVSVTLQEGV